MFMPIIRAEEEDLYLLWQAEHQAATPQQRFTVRPGNPAEVVRTTAAE